MPILKNRETEVLELPVSGAQITITKDINYASIIEIFDKDLDLNKKSTSLELAVLFIVDWDLTDESGEKLPISVDVIKMLEVDDGNYLVLEITNRFNKKKI